MDLQYYDKKFVIKDLDYEMVQVILNGINCERKKIIDTISYLNNCLHQEYTTSQKYEFRVQMDYLKNRCDELNDIWHNGKMQLENMSFINK
jgi:hypothetical protein